MHLVSNISPYFELLGVFGRLSQDQICVLTVLQGTPYDYTNL